MVKAEILGEVVRVEAPGEQVAQLGCVEGLLLTDDPAAQVAGQLRDVADVHQQSSFVGGAWMNYGLFE